MAETTLFDVRLRDPLSEVTRKERRFLLGVSLVGIALVKTGLVPSKISALGIEFAQTDQRSLLYILGLVVLYFLAAFIIYAISDFLAWKLAIAKEIQETIRQRAQPIDKAKDKISFLQDVITRSRIVYVLSPSTAIVRGVFDFLLPIIVGIYAVVLLWTAKLA